jgi:hypothetical protein
MQTVPPANAQAAARERASISDRSEIKTSENNGTKRACLNRMAVYNNITCEAARQMNFVKISCFLC